MPDPVIFLGLGFTTTRLARRMSASGRACFAAVREPERYTDLEVKVSGFDPQPFPRRAIVVHTIPPVPEPNRSQIRHFLQAIQPVRVVYISATSVYGEQERVDASSVPAPSTEAGIRRREEEIWIESGHWSSFILRAAAIYGPGRGAHRRLLDASAKADSQRRGPSGLVSRIHVDDLGSLIEAAVDSTATGAFPVADRLPCSTTEILGWCAERLGIPEDRIPGGPMTTGRNVDGATVAELLNVQLAYPDYRAGVEQCLREEGVLSR